MKIVKYLILMSMLAFSTESFADNCAVKQKQSVRHVHKKKHFFYSKKSVPINTVIYERMPIAPIRYESKPIAQPENKKKHLAMVETTGFDTVIEIPMRTGGLIATFVGSVLFVVSSPITGLMTAFSPPHNAIKKAGEFLVLRPYKFTFARPTSGNTNYDIRPDSEK